MLMIKKNPCIIFKKIAGILAMIYMVLTDHLGEKQLKSKLRLVFAYPAVTLTRIQFKICLKYQRQVQEKVFIKWEMSGGKHQ